MMVFYIFGSLVIILLLGFVINRIINFNKLKATNELESVNEVQMQKEYEEFRQQRL